MTKEDLELLILYQRKYLPEDHPDWSLSVPGLDPGVWEYYTSLARATFGPDPFRPSNLTRNKDRILYDILCAIRDGWE